MLTSWLRQGLNSCSRFRSIFYILLPIFWHSYLDIIKLQNFWNYANQILAIIFILWIAPIFWHRQFWSVIFSLFNHRFLRLRRIMLFEITVVKKLLAGMLYRYTDVQIKQFVKSIQIFTKLHGVRCCSQAVNVNIIYK